MAIKTLTSSKTFSGTIRVPADKSITHRALLLSALANGVSTIKNPLPSEDCLSTAACLEQLGCKVEKSGESWTVTGGTLKKPAAPLNCGNSGTTMRLLAGILAAQNFDSTLIGDASLSKRPMKRVADPLTAMGASVQLANEKFPPVKISGSASLKPIQWKNPVASAQVKSCVLLASLFVNGEVQYEEPHLSRDHTERMLQSMGVKLKKSGHVMSLTGPAKLEATTWVVPGDFSSAAFFIAGACLLPGSKVEVLHVNLNPSRTGLLHVLKEAGASITVHNEKNVGGEPVGDVYVEGGPLLKPLTFSKEILPSLIDEIPILAVAATQAQGKTEIRNIEELRIKETDRIRAMTENLKKMGARVQEVKDGLLIEGPTPLNGAAVRSFDDHRIAMSLAIASRLAKGETQIEGSESVAISYPDFWTTFEQVCQA